MLALMDVAPAIVSIEEALALSRQAFKNKSGPEIRGCPQYWREVFIRYYEDTPTSYKDPRWDPLFKVGMPALRKMLCVD